MQVDDTSEEVLFLKQKQEFAEGFMVLRHPPTKNLLLCLYIFCLPWIDYLHCLLVRSWPLDVIFKNLQMIQWKKSIVSELFCKILWILGFYDMLRL